MTKKKTKKNGITAMLISTAETVGLSQSEILACQDKESLVAAIKCSGKKTKKDKVVSAELKFDFEIAIQQLFDEMSAVDKRIDRIVAAMSTAKPITKDM